ncbi:MAG: ribosome biogenesis GTPase YlqF [Oscillospiraceae bacterium]|nr:ribosome biogenesis GTPase YlqF [Oscillospiraceae bacterium]MDD3833140.1 ribosome biogenesis GTPase YlqF [Oscillospiraceae bacterium]
MEIQMSNIQWYPGHMTKTKRRMKTCMPLVDLVVEIIDARIPASSRNPDLGRLSSGKPRIILLNKADIADEAVSAGWVQHFGKQGIHALIVDCKSGRGLGAFSVKVNEIMGERIAAWKRKGMVNRPIRMMIAGIPNSGKSSFINRIAQGGKAKVEDRPGVTRANQWYTTKDGFEMLDTPGILWPKFDDQRVAQHLAYTGAIRDEVLDKEDLACGLLSILYNNYTKLLVDRYKTDDITLHEEIESWELLNIIGRKRGMLISGGEVDTERAATMILDEFRGGKIGRITLEKP